MTSENRKSISVRFDDTIDSLLRFFHRFLATHANIAFRPHRPAILLNALQVDPPLYTRPLTFLAIGAFWFALLIDVYPAGFTGLIDIIWFEDEIKDNVSERWKEALTLTTLVTAGLPVILAVSVLAGASSRLLFLDSGRRRLWFAASCYAFGYLATALFALMSISALGSVAVALFPILDRPWQTGSFTTAIQVLALLALVTFTQLVPFIFVASTFLALNPKATLVSKLLSLGFTFVYWVFGIYLIAQAASVVPTLKTEYFPDAVPEVMIFEEMKFQHHPEADTVDILFQVIVENPTNKDLLLELSNTHVSVVLSAGPKDPPTESWAIQKVNLPRDTHDLVANRVVIPKISNRLVDIKATLNDAQAFSCKSAQLIDKNEELIRSGELDEAFQTLRLAFEANFRLRTERALPTTRMLPDDHPFSKLCRTGH